MFCNKCGRKLAAGDIFCPGCGSKIEWEREEIPAEEILSDAETLEVKEESFDFKWNLDDFSRERHKEGNIEWGDLLGVEANKKETKPLGEFNFETPERKPVSDFSFESVTQEKKEEPEAEPVIEEVAEEQETPKLKGQAFQDLLKQERDEISEESVKAEEADVNKVIELENDEPAADASEELPDAPEKEITIAEEGTEEDAAKQLAELTPAEQPKKLSFFEKRRKKKEEKLAALAAANETKVIEPLRLDEDDLSGEYSIETAAEEVPEVKVEEITSVEETVPVKEPVNQIDEMAEARSRLFNTPIEELIAADAAASEKSRFRTQTMNRADFGEFLKSVEKQFGIDEIDAEISEEKAEPVAEIPEEKPAAEEPVVETVPEETAPVVETVPEETAPAVETVPEENAPAAEPAPVVEEKEKKDTGAFKLGEFEDDNFWGDDADAASEETGEGKKKAKKGSRVGTVIIVILAVILAAELGIMVIRYSFPDSGLAQFIEPKLTLVENFIRGLF